MPRRSSSDVWVHVTQRHPRPAGPSSAQDHPRRRESPSSPLRSGEQKRRHRLAFRPLQKHGNRIQFILRQRFRSPTKLHGNVVQSTGCKSRPEMPQPRHDDLGDGQTNLLSRLIDNEHLQTSSLDPLPTKQQVVCHVIRMGVFIIAHLPARHCCGKEIRLICNRCGPQPFGCLGIRCGVTGTFGRIVQQWR